MESPPPQLLGECRPRSCVDSVSGSADLAATARKRWSVNLGGKLIQAYDRLGDDTEEEYTDRYSLSLSALTLLLNQCLENLNNSIQILYNKY